MGGTSLHFVMKTLAVCIKWIVCCSEAKQDIWMLSPNTEVILWNHLLAFSWMWCWKPWGWHTLLRSDSPTVNGHMSKHLLPQTLKQSHISQAAMVHSRWPKSTMLIKKGHHCSDVGKLPQNKEILKTLLKVILSFK